MLRKNARRGRKSALANKSQRDEWLNGEIYKIDKEIQKKKTDIANCNYEIKEIFRQKGRRDLVEGFYGMAIDFIVVPEEFMICTEAAIGEKLFQFIMKSNKVAKAYIAVSNISYSF